VALRISRQGIIKRMAPIRRSHAHLLISGRHLRRPSLPRNSIPWRPKPSGERCVLGTCHSKATWGARTPEVLCVLVARKSCNPGGRAPGALHFFSILKWLAARTKVPRSAARTARAGVGTSVRVRTSRGFGPPRFACRPSSPATFFVLRGEVQLTPRRGRRADPRRCGHTCPWCGP
jgi:hypothetical protein